jgi:hypothetical protein
MNGFIFTAGSWVYGHFGAFLCRNTSAFHRSTILLGLTGLDEACPLQIENTCLLSHAHVVHGLFPGVRSLHFHSGKESQGHISIAAKLARRLLAREAFLNCSLYLQCMAYI